MNKYCLAALAVALAGCNNIETALLIQHVAVPDDDCSFPASGDEALFDIQFDPYDTTTLGLGLRVTNNLAAGTVRFGSDQDAFTLPNSVTPTRFDLRWECDSNGFQDDVGDLYLPQFSTTEPFCLADDTREFRGFDVVPASGSAIAPGQTALVFVRPITQQLGRAFADVFEIAKQAQACCDSTPTKSCDDTQLQAAPQGPNSECGRLQNLFDVVAGPNKLSATSFEDIQKFRPYSLFDQSVTDAGNNLVGPSYQLRLRGVLEGTAGDGSIVSSTEFTTQIGVCAHCGSTQCTGL